MLAEAVQARPGVGGDPRPVHPQGREALGLGPLGQLRVDALAGHHQRGEQGDPAPGKPPLDLVQDGGGLLGADGQVAVWAVLGAELHIEQAQVGVDLGEGAHGALVPAAAGALLDGHGGRDAEDGIHIGAGGGLDELAGIGVEGLQIAPLPLGEEDIEGQRTLAAAGDPGDDRELPVGDADAQVLEVVLAGVADVDDRGGQGSGCRRGEGAASIGHPGPFPLQVPQGTARMAAGVGGDLVRGPGAEDVPAAVAALGTQVYDPVRGADHIQIVLDHQQGVALVQQAAQGGKEGGDVVEVQPCGGLVEDEQQAAGPGAPLARASGLGQVPGELEALGLAPGQGRYRLAQTDIAQAHRRKGGQGTQDLG